MNVLKILSDLQLYNVLLLLYHNFVLKSRKRRIFIENNFWFDSSFPETITVGYIDKSAKACYNKASAFLGGHYEFSAFDSLY
jgi:hypothetical protein